ncbi:MAG: SPFH domain / Band 7 family protein [Candidatus Daviesbacteria bacterium GW2011_GWA2_38_24]|uniref:SPFH domain / Band 7 family protein n=1 Tax=Candidatus Daviesbacteria bacterium GW2011_GWA2_38_24 TaxID=1618422 RepID=A0A0G0M198_9BACT|nr:MAG: SPFH domain / Band 7 family protein [Candidatus Daviesbacteria bacterium GW2011_GWA2_38_24]
MEFLSISLLLLTVFILLISIKQINQYERGILFTFGKYTGMLEPGWRIVIPVIQGYQRVDIRTKAVDVPDQEAITKDNVSARISAVIYYKVTNAAKAVLEVENFYFAVHQLAQTTMRNVVGEVDLDSLLANRDAVATRIKDIVKETTTSWGLEVISVELKDIILPENMKRTMAKQAEAEREKRATIINSEGEVVAAQNLAKAAKLMGETPGALHLRTLNSINDISSDQSNTVVFAVPVEVLRAIEGLVKKIDKRSEQINN